MGGHHCKKKNDAFITPLKKAKGLGSAHHGVGHWMAQKITAIVNVPLILWLVFSIVKLQGASYGEFTGWMAQPLNAILMICLVVSVLYHATLGAQVITEDYIHCKAFKMVKLVGQKVFFTALGIACVFSVLKIAFTAGM